MTTWIIVLHSQTSVRSPANQEDHGPGITLARATTLIDGRTWPIHVVPMDTVTEIRPVPWPSHPSI